MEPYKAFDLDQFLKQSLVLRMLSALILGPLILWILYDGGWPFWIMVVLAFKIAGLEWFSIVREDAQSLRLKILGVLYLSFCFSSFLILSLFPDGNILTLFLMLLIWSSDSGAYVFGKTFGGAKLFPAVSPNKTWAGFCGAVFVPVCFGALLLSGLKQHMQYDFSSIPFFYFVLIASLVGIAGQIGDLIVSYFKRKSGLKDTGNLIPGHGGLLDRIDGLLLASPVFLVLIWLWL